MELLTKALKDKIVKCAQANNLSFFHWGHSLSKGSIVYKQLDGNSVGVQIFIPERRGYAGFEKAKSEFDAVFNSVALQCQTERDLGANSGWHKELVYSLETSDRNSAPNNTPSKPLTFVSTDSMNYNALIIGVNEYANKQCYPDLMAVSNDVTTIWQILKDSPCNYQTIHLTGRNATSAKIVRKLNHFFDSEEDDVLFLYWAGHGTTNHFIAYDTDPADMNGTAIDLKCLADLIEQTRSRAVVIVLDCCHSGAIARGTPHFALNIQGDGKVIMASSDYFQQSYESVGIGHGHFTHCFVQGLGGGAESDTGLVTVTGLHDFICEQLATISQSSQTPVLKATVAGQFVLNKVEPKQVAQPTVAQGMPAIPNVN